MGIGQTTSKTRVLVVDDDAAGRRELRQRLSDAGYDVAEAADSRAALERVAFSPPDLVVLDRRLPDLDGVTVCRALKAEYPTLPVLMLTAAGTSEERLAGFAAGADDYVTKPYEAKELLARLAVFDRLRRAEMAAQRQAAEMTMLLTLTRVLLAEPGPLLVLRRAAEVAQQLVPAESVSIALVEPRGWRIVGLRTVEGWQDVELVGSAADGLHGWVARHGQPSRMSERIDPLIAQALADVLAVRSAMVVPLPGDGDMVLALLAFYNRRGEPDFTDDDERMALALGVQAALVLENRRLLASKRDEGETPPSATDSGEVGDADAALC